MGTDYMNDYISDSINDFSKSDSSPSLFGDVEATVLKSVVHNIVVHLCMEMSRLAMRW